MFKAVASSTQSSTWFLRYVEVCTLCFLGRAMVCRAVPCLFVLYVVLQPGWLPISRHPFLCTLLLSGHTFLSSSTCMGPLFIRRGLHRWPVEGGLRFVACCMGHGRGPWIFLWHSHWGREDFQASGGRAWRTHGASEKKADEWELARNGRLRRLEWCIRRGG